MTDENTAQRRSLRWLAYPIAISLILFLTFVWHNSYQANVQALEKIQSQLNNQNNTNNDGLPWLNTLNKLNNTLSILQHSRTHAIRWTGLNSTARIRHTALVTYQKILLQKFQPYLESTIINTLQHNIGIHPESVFRTLRTYLIISNPQRFDAKVITQWFQTYWQHQYPDNPTLQQQLAQHLSALLALRPSWQRDSLVIEKARQFLRQLTMAQLGMIMLRGQYPNTAVPILPRKEYIKGVDLTRANIPLFYTTNQFNAIYTRQIPNIIDIMNRYDWVMGYRMIIQFTPKQATQLITRAQNIYLKNYVQQWQQVIDNIKLTKPRNLNELENTLNLLRRYNSPLMKLLSIVIGNATLGNNEKSKEFTAIENFIHHNNTQNIHTALNELSQTITAINDSNDPTQSAYLAAVHRFKRDGKNDAITQMYNIAESAPQPIRSWLDTTADSAWTILLTNAKHYLNVIWTTTALPEYDANILNHFPIFPGSKTNMSMKQFVHFFGPKGTVSTFFVYYLQPFVNMSQHYWTWKKVNGQSVPISQKNLNMFIRASLIQQMFFTDNTQTASFQMTLTPNLISKGLNGFTLNIDGQIVNSHKNNVASQTITWPGPNPDQTTIRFDVSHGLSPTITMFGPWSWFRMLQNAIITPTSNPRAFQLTFKMNNYQAIYNLVADNRVNPFLPNVLNAFRCPKQL